MTIDEEWTVQGGSVYRVVKRYKGKVLSDTGLRTEPLFHLVGSIGAVLEPHKARPL